MYNFIIKSGLLQFKDYVERDLYTNQTDSGNIQAKTFNWSEQVGGLVVGIEPMAQENYTAIPIKRNRITQNEAGKVNRIKLTIGDRNFSNSQLFLGNVDLIKGAKIVIRRTFKGLVLTEPGSYKLVFRGYVTAVSANEGNIVLEVAERYYDWNKPLNKRLFQKHCGFRFKGTRCQYAGAETFCDKTYPQCQEYNNTDHFGGFPDLPTLQFKRF